ncbi:hypothetical protein O0L34_g15432 [Tuta absoluta]|nr:hypothetical protein O0L34_g15432 [Tuta absoluta]
MGETKRPEEMKQLVQQMREWLNTQPHLPKDVDDRVLERFIHSCYFDLEKAQTAADLFFTIRGSAGELVTNRDPLSPAMQKALKIVKLGQIKISGNRQLWIWQLNDPGLDNYDYLQDAKVFFLSTDAWLLNNEEFSEADVVLMDVKDISLKFITKFNVSVAKKMSKYQEDAMPIRLKQIHIVNAPPFIDKLYGLMKPFLKHEITEMIHFHGPKSDTLHQYLSKEDLPSDYGGTLPDMVEQNKRTTEIIMKFRDELNQDNLWRATKIDKKGKKNGSSEAATSFRSLAID